VIAEREAALVTANAHAVTLEAHLTKVVAELRATIEECQAALDGARDRMSRAEAEGVELRRTLARVEEEARRSAAEVSSARDEAAALREELEAGHAIGVRLVTAFRSDLYSAAAPAGSRPPELVAAAPSHLALLQDPSLHHLTYLAVNIRESTV
jgi:hypothetical protein